MKKLLMLALIIAITGIAMGVFHHHATASDPEGTEIPDDTIKVPESVTFPGEEQSNDAQTDFHKTNACDGPIPWCYT